MSPSEAAGMRVLIAAEHASTRLGGEAILPYHYFRLLRARGLDAHLVVHERTRGELETTFAGDLAHVHFVRDRLLQKLLYRMGRVLPRRIDEATLGLANQLLTQLGQRGVLRGLVTRRTVVHQPIPVSPRFPSLLYGLGAPVVIGPLNGGMEFPPALRGAESAWTRTAIALGRRFADVANAVFPGKRRAAVVLVANARTRAALPSGLGGTVLELAENGVDTTHWIGDEDSGVEHGGVRFVFVGRLVDWKALDVVLDALGQVENAALDVIGDGPMREAWTEQALAAGLGERVRFLGWKTQAECAGLLAGCCGLVLPSVYECGGAVVLEAMARRVPVIATAWGGPLDYLDAECGVLVPPSSRAALVTGFAHAMRLLGSSPAVRVKMGAAGCARVLREFSWERKIDAMIEVFEAALHGSEDELT